MKKITLLLSAFIISCSFTFKSKADTHGFFEGPFAEGQLYFRNIPQVCGHVATVQEYLTLHGFEKHSASVGRSNAYEDGEPVYMVVMYMTRDKKQLIPVVVVPGVAEACMVFRSFDRYEFNAEE